MQYGLVLPLSGIDGEIERLVEYAHIAEEEGWFFARCPSRGF